MARPANVPGTERKVNKVGGRARDLARRVSGLMFNILNQGGWLSVTTNDVGPGDLGIDLEDASGAGARLGSTGSTEVAGATTVGVDGGVGAHFGTGGTGPSLEATLTDMGVNLKTGQKLVVRNNANVVIFEFREDGSFHIPTGTAPIADL